jgi:dipeptidyl aminopeptidase/acylaminoacyl peptidase
VKNSSALPAIPIAVLAALILSGSALLTSAAPVSALAFSPDGSVLASSGYKAVILHSQKDGGVQQKIECEFPRVTSITFDSSGKYLAIGGGEPGVDGVALLLDWKTKTVLRKFTGFQDLVTGLAFSPQGNALAVVSADRTASIHFLQSGQTTSDPIKLVGHSGPILAVAFSPDGELISTASSDRSIKVWAAGDGKLLRSLNHHTESVHALAFKPWKTGILECASGSDDQTVRIWQPGIGRMVRIVRKHEGPVFALVYSPDGLSLFSAGKEGLVRRVDAESDEILGQWKCHDEPIYSMALSPDGAILATGDWSGKLKLWSVLGTNLVLKSK